MPVDPDKYRSASYSNWERLAPNWVQEREFLASAAGPVGALLIERLDPEPGDTVLELAAGTGDLSSLVAERLGDGGKLICTDFAPAMVEAERATLAARGFDETECRVLDAEDMDLDDDSVDKVLCRWGYMLMADPGAALAETRRVLGDGGRLSFAVWGPPDKNLWASLPAMVLVERGHLPPPDPGTPGIFAMADPGRIKGLLSEAGFDEPRIEQATIDWPYADDPDEHWRLTLALAGPLAEAIEQLPEDERESVREEVRTRFDPADSVAGLTHVVTVE
jgi:SAM-dependent methyltransferase